MNHPSLNDPTYGLKHAEFHRWVRYEIFGKGKASQSFGFIYANSLARAEEKLKRLPRAPGAPEVYIWMHVERAHCRNLDCDFPAKPISGWCEHHERLASSIRDADVWDAIASGFKVRVEPHISVVAKGTTGFGEAL